MAMEQENERPIEDIFAPPSNGQEPAPSEEGFSDEEFFKDGRSWYVIHTYSGYENRVRQNLEHRIESMDAGDLIHRVIVPTVDEIEVHGGVRRTVSQARTSSASGRFCSPLA